MLNHKLPPYNVKVAINEINRYFNEKVYPMIEVFLSWDFYTGLGSYYHLI